MSLRGAPSTRSMSPARWLPALVPFAILVATGLRGIDFGFHWDEPYHIKTIRTSIERGTPLPGEYRYPSMSYWLVLAGALPDLTRAASQSSSTEQIRAWMLSAVEHKPYRLRTRALFLVATALAVPLTYALVLLWRRRVAEAFVAACILGLSWEVAYHARWIAPDGLAMLFAASTSMLAVLAVLRPDRRGLPWAGAASAGLALATKWPAGLLLVPVWIAAWWNARDQAIRARVRRTIALGALAAAVYLLATPGTLLEPGAMLASLEMQQSIYSRGHLGHGVAPGWEHLLRVGEWLALSLASPWAPVSCAFFALALVGAVALWRESRPLAFTYLSFPILHLAFFAFYSTVIVRNYLTLAPFVAVLSARGFFALLDRLPGRVLRGVAGAAVGLAFAADAAWLVHAAETIRDREETSPLPPLAAYLAAHPDVHYAASPRVLKALRQAGLRPGPHVGTRVADADEVVVHASDAYSRIVRARARHDLTRAWFGPYDVNINYYPAWLGADRILVMPLDHYPRRSYLPSWVPAKLRPGALSETPP